MEQLPPNAAIEPLNKHEYYDMLTADINATRAGGRVVVTTMTLLPDVSEVSKLMNALEKAAKRDVHVIFGFDAYNFLINPVSKGLGPLFYNQALPAKPRGIYAQLLTEAERLRSAGATVAITNRPARTFRNPFAGRSHLKMAVVDNTVYVGGCNLSKPDDIDVMVRFNSERTADWLHGTMRQALAAPSVREALNKKDLSFPVDANTQLLLDAGERDQSLIFDTALQFIDDVQDWLFITCQFFPNSITAARLLAAQRRGVDVQILYNHPLKHRGLQHKALQSMVRTRERFRMPDSFFAHELPRSSNFLHAKLLASERGAIVGSHNYVEAGVRFGTAELALKRDDLEFGTQLAEFIKRHIS